jgi:hypothetical protein
MQVWERKPRSRGGASRLLLGLVLLLAIAILVASWSGKSRAAVHPVADPAPSALPAMASTPSPSPSEESGHLREEATGDPEAPKPLEAREPSPLVEDAAGDPALRRARWSDADAGSGGILGVVSGRVVNADGEPCKAHVALVSSDSGSIGLGTAPDGSFEFSSAGMFGHATMTGEIALFATTDDGRVAVLGAIGARDSEDAADIVLTLEPGAKLSITLDGVYDSLRCRLLHDGVIFEDFTLRKNQPASEVVPTGPLLVQLYSDSGEDLFVRDERALDPRAGDALEAVFLVER